MAVPPLLDPEKIETEQKSGEGELAKSLELKLEHYNCKLKSSILTPDYRNNVRLHKIKAGNN